MPWQKIVLEKNNTPASALARCKIIRFLAKNSTRKKVEFFKFFNKNNNQKIRKKFINSFDF